jgi:PIN domain nuclease of toxin-antitoxin system
MKLLLDTHTFLWFISDSPRLSERARSLVQDSSNQVFLSIASVWEIAIKVSLGKLMLTSPFETLIPQQIQLNRFDLLAIDLRHTLQVSTLPFHHRDPFDRLLIAQACVESIPLLSADPLFDSYDVTRLW